MLTLTLTLTLSLSLSLPLTPYLLPPTSYLLTLGPDPDQVVTSRLSLKAFSQRSAFNPRGKHSPRQ